VSEKTAQELAQARELEATRKAEARAAEIALLAAAARGIPERVEELGRRTAHAQPDAAKALGKEGIATLRAELATRAAEIAAELEAAVDEVKWPSITENEFRKHAQDQRDVLLVLFHHLYGHRLNSLAAIFKRHGFNTHAHADGGQSLVYAQSLYSETTLTPQVDAVVSALKEVSAAEAAVKRAKAEDDKDAVESLWE